MSSTMSTSYSRANVLRRTGVLFAFAIVLFMRPGWAPAQDVDAPITQEIPIPVRVVSPGASAIVVARGQVTTAMELLQIEAAPILEAITSALEADVQAQLDAAGGDTWLTADELEAIGFELVFDTADLAAEIRIPVSALGTQELSVYRRRTLPSFPTAENAEFAVGFPLWVSFGQTRPRIGETQTETTLSAAPGIFYRDWVLESDPSVEITNDDVETEIENTRVVHTWAESGIRVQGGQILQFSRGLQVSERLLGASVDNLQSDSERALVPAVLDRPLEVITPGTIDVFVNGRRSRSFQVQPGRYLVGDVPLASGINSIWIEYTDEEGETQRYELVVPHTGGLLEHRRWIYAVSAGVEEETPDRVSGAGFLRYGLLPQLTVGALLDTSTRGTQSGLDLTTALPFGELSTGGYLSADEDATIGWALEGGVRFRLLGQPMLPTVSTSVDYRSPEFIRPTPEVNPTKQQWQVTSGISQALPGDVGLVVGHVLRTYHGDTAPSSFLYGSLIRSIGARFSLKVSGFTDFEDPSERWGVSITFSGRSLKRSVSGAVTYDAKDSTADLTGSAGFDGTVTVNGNAGVKGVSIEDGTFGGMNGSVRAAHPRGDIRGTASLTMEEGPAFGDQQIRSTRYSIQGGAGMYYADRTFAVARPLRSAFTLVRPSDTLPTDRVFVAQGSRGRDSVRSGILGAAVVGPLQPNQTEALSVRVPGVPADYSLTGTDFLVEPTYRSGTAITISTLQQLYVRGTLVDEEGQPVSYIGLTVEPQFELPQEIEIGTTAFTDDAGVFDLYGLVPGTYLVTLEDGSTRVFVIEVPDVPGPLVQAGEIVPEERNNDTTE